ncbi:MAG: DUF91 domain-containing protein [Phycisphaerales bacterium]|nr:DUF91 domain-containing protein [Phycisphaerales bacterium]
MRNYHKVKLGSGGEYFAECLQGGFVGTDFEITEDLTGRLYSTCSEFNREFVPIQQGLNPGKTKASAVSDMSKLWTVSKGILVGDLVISPDGAGGYRAAEVIGEYYYVPGGNLPHRRRVRWHHRSFAEQELSATLRASILSSGTTSSLNAYAKELDILLGSSTLPTDSQRTPCSTNEAFDAMESADPEAFALEKHLENFLVKNWAQTELGKEYDIFRDGTESFGQQFPTDTGAIDILAISKDKKRLLVVELKKGRANDKVVVQVLRYMGFVKQELAEQDQEVRGVIIALEDDLRLRRALAVAPGIEFFRYQVSFKLHKA